MLKLKKNKKLTFEIAIAGMSTAFVVICLALAFYSPVAKLSFFALSGVALLLPLVAGSYRGAILAYLAGGALSLLFSPINVVPFAFIFGLQVLLMEFCKRFFKNKWYISIPIKVIIINAALIGVYYLYGLDVIIKVFDKLGWGFKYIYAALIASPLFVLYDYVFQGVEKWLKKRLSKVVSKYNPSANKPDDKKEQSVVQNGQDDNQQDIFGIDDLPSDKPQNLIAEQKPNEDKSESDTTKH